MAIDHTDHGAMGDKSSKSRTPGILYNVAIGAFGTESCLQRVFYRPEEPV